MEIKLPQDVLKKIFILLDSEIRASICCVSRDFALASIATSRMLARIPVVYDPKHIITLNELLVIIESGDYHAFVRHQHTIKYHLVLRTRAEEFHLLDTAFSSNNINIIMTIIVKGTIETTHIYRITDDDIYIKIMDTIMTNSAASPRSNNPTIDINMDDSDMLEILMEYAIAHEHSDNILHLLSMMSEYNGYSPSDFLTLACSRGVSLSICNIFIDHGAKRCDSPSCPGHRKLDKRLNTYKKKRATSRSPTRRRRRAVSKSPKRIK